MLHEKIKGSQKNVTLVNLRTVHRTVMQRYKKIFFREENQQKQS